MGSSPPPGRQASSSNRRKTFNSDGSPLLIYQVWEGRNKFFCGGRFIFGPDVKSLFLTFSIILVPMLLFWVFVAKGLISAFPHGYVMVALSVALNAYSYILLLLTSGRDPGIIPRNGRPLNPEDHDSANLSREFPSSGSSVGMPSAKGSTAIPLVKTVVVNGTLVKVKYCQTCMLYRPPRCSHCSICNNCVECFDHHCPWVGQCIGKRNYRCFFLFVSSTAILCLYILVCCSMYIKKIVDKEGCSCWGAILKSPVSGILIIYTFMCCWFVGGLTIFHLHLISTNQTTYENFRYHYERNMNPYNLGFTQNFKEALCSRIPVSRNNFREAAVPCDPPIGSATSAPPSEPGTNTDTQKGDPDE